MIELLIAATLSAADFAPPAVHASLKNRKRLLVLSPSERETWMTQAGFVHRETSLLGVHNRETL
jgi:hypothetical protein